jgi:hypothetical protein
MYKIKIWCTPVLHITGLYALRALKRPRGSVRLGHSAAHPGYAGEHSRFLIAAQAASLLHPQFCGAANLWFAYLPCKTIANSRNVNRFIRQGRFPGAPLRRFAFPPGLFPSPPSAVCVMRLIQGGQIKLLRINTGSRTESSGESARLNPSAGVVDSRWRRRIIFGGIVCIYPV